MLVGCSKPGDESAATASAAGPTREDFSAAPGLDRYPARRNPGYVVERALTSEKQAGRYNNFYEFTANKDVYRYVRDYQPYPWTIEVAGLCEHPRRWDLDVLMREFPLEERVYRHRCVEAWSMVVPWTGFPLAALVKASGPQSDAMFVKLTSLLRPAAIFSLFPRVPPFWPSP